MLDLKFMATLQPELPHFPRFVRDERLMGVRLNNPHWTSAELSAALASAAKSKPRVPLYFDVKGWQLRVTETHLNDRYLDITLNHRIEVETPTMVIFKAGADSALLERVEEDGRRLIFRGGPEFLLKPGESLQIRHPSLRILDKQFTLEEEKKIEVARKAGINRYFLSYVSSQKDVDELLERVGSDSEVMLKIESLQGLGFVERSFRKQKNLKLVAARGDLYVEIARPHDIMRALQLIISKDPEACVASRLMLSVVQGPVPSCADFLELAWLYDAGYRSMMLCDELCLKEDLLATAMNAVWSFRKAYQPAWAASILPAVAPDERRASNDKPFWRRWLGI